MENSKPNPYGANGDKEDPREQTCWDNYVKTLLDNRPNAYQSAIDAEYAEDTARNITTNDWFKERLGKLKRKDMLSKAERNLDKVLDFEMKDDEGKVLPQVASIVVGVSTTVVKTLGKDEGYSERTEMTGKNGEAIIITGMQISNDTPIQDKE